MSFSVNPGTFRSMEIETAKEQKFFLHQLSDLLTQITTQLTAVQGSNRLGAILNGSGALNYNALNTSLSVLGTVTTNQTINVNSAAIVAVSFTFSASITLTLNNLGLGVPVAVLANSTGAFTLKMTATIPGGTAYTGISYVTGGAITSLLTTGWVAGAGAVRIFVGTTNTGPILQMAFV